MRQIVVSGSGEDSAPNRASRRPCQCVEEQGDSVVIGVWASPRSVTQ